MEYVHGSSVEVEACIERAKQLRAEFTVQQLRRSVAALSRLIHRAPRAAASGIAGVSVQCDRPMGMQDAHAHCTHG